MLPRLFAILVVAAIATALWRRLNSNRTVSKNEDIDEKILSEAESELDDVSAFSSPEEAAEEIPDWGPGAPK